MKEKKICVICKKEFTPLILKQQTCGKKECRYAYQLEKQKQKYWKNRTRKNKPIDKEWIDSDLVRKFSVTFFIINKKWYWEAIGDNGSKLSNGPFDSIREAKEDYEGAI